jgi:hypothetical protein
VTNNGNDCQTQFNVQFGGEKNLKPEKSKNFTLGTVLEPVNNVSIGIDYFKVRLENTIVNGVNPAVILSDTAQYASLITRAPQTPADIAAGIPGRSLRSTRSTSTSARQALRPRLRRQVAHSDRRHGAVHDRRHGDLLHQLRHLEHRRLLHRQRRPHQRGDGRRHPAVQELSLGRLEPRAVRPDGGAELPEALPRPGRTRSASPSRPTSSIAPSSRTRPTTSRAATNRRNHGG